VLYCKNTVERNRYKREYALNLLKTRFQNHKTIDEVVK